MKSTPPMLTKAQGTYEEDKSSVASVVGGNLTLIQTYSYFLVVSDEDNEEPSHNITKINTPHRTSREIKIDRDASLEQKSSGLGNKVRSENIN